MYGVSETVTNVEFAGLPISIAICDQCLSKKMQSYNFLKSKPITEEKIMGETLAIKLLTKDLESKGYDYFMTASDYFLYAINDWTAEISRMINNCDAYGLLYPLDIYGCVYQIDEKRYNIAIQAIKGLEIIGNISILNDLKEINKRQLKMLQANEKYEKSKSSEKQRLGNIVNQLSNNVIEKIGSK
jgi:hypothetical protein